MVDASILGLPPSSSYRLTFSYLPHPDVLVAKSSYLRFLYSPQQFCSLMESFQNDVTSEQEIIEPARSNLLSILQLAMLQGQGDPAHALG